MMHKIKVGIIGTGNIGTDILLKLKRSPILNCGIFAGRNPDSSGIKLAQEIGVPTTTESIHYIEEHPNCCDIIFDATSAMVHMENAPILKKLGKYAIDLTPAKVGKLCVPVINLKECIDVDNVNLITCGGQGSIPIAYAISRVHPDTEYIEIVASIASKSAGLGTRNNIDEFTQTTKEALLQFTGLPKAKAIIILNPAEPPITMRNTIYAKISNPNIRAIKTEIENIAQKIRKYVPGYKVILGPVEENGRVTTTVEVRGSGDYLPPYSGNLDIITCAAIEIAEKYATIKLKGGEKK